MSASFPGNVRHSLPEILNQIKIPFERIGGTGDDTFTSVKPYDEADEDSLIFLNQPDPHKFSHFTASPARLGLLLERWGRENPDLVKQSGKVIFLVRNPRMAVAKILDLLVEEEDMIGPGIHATAIVHPEAQIHETVGIGAYCIIEKCIIGEGCRILSHSVIHSGVTLGSRVIIREFCVIGGHSMGLVRDEETGKLQRIPHIGGVIIEDDVEIHPFCHVDRGTLGNTFIGSGTRIAHFVLVAHNVHVGSDCIITPNIVLCGTSRVGDRAWIGVGTILKEGLKMGDDSYSGLGAVIIRDVAPGEVVAGVPARKIR